MKATFRVTKLKNGTVRYAVVVNGKTQSTYTGGKGCIRTEKEAYFAAVCECKRINGEISISEDRDFGLIVGSALRYALPRHSYMVSVVADFIERHWDTPSVRRQHEIILRDIKEFLEQRDEDHEMFDGMDYRVWKSLYEYLTANDVRDT